MPLQEHRQSARARRRSELTRLRANRRSGSSIIAGRAVRILIAEVCSPHGAMSLPGLRRELAALVQAHPAMALLHNLQEAIESSIRRGEDLPSVDRRRIVAGHLRAWQGGLQQARLTLAEHAANTIPTRCPLLLLSHSGTVLETCHRLARERRVHTIVCESRPAREGVLMARALSLAECDVTVITDAAAGTWISLCGAVILGADWVDRRGFVNKTGSRMLSILAADADLPVFVLADSFRIRKQILRDDQLPTQNPRQLLARSTQRLLAVNRCFERVEWMPVHRLITESGLSDKL